MTDSRKSRDELLDELRDLRHRIATAAADSATEIDAGARRVPRLLEHLRAMMVEVDDRERLVYVSPNVVDILGYAPEEFRARPGIDWVHEEDQAGLREIFEKVRTSGEPAHAIYRARHRDGSWRWLDTTSTACPGPDGATHTVWFTRDVTEWKKASESFRGSEHRLRALTEHASDVITETDIEGRLLFVSPNCERLLGYAASELVDKSLFQDVILHNVHPDDRTRVIEAFLQHSKSLEGDQIEYRYQHADGDWRWIESRFDFFETLAGEARCVVVSRDVTERVQAREQVRSSQERFQMLADKSHDLITEMDSEGRLLYASPACPRVLGFEPSELIGTTPFGIVHPDDIDRAVDSFLDAHEEKNRGRKHPFRVRHRDGSWRWVEGAGFTYRTATDELRILAVTRDITERRHAEEQRRALEERSLQAHKLESLGILAGGIAHDFADLLTPILGDARLAMQDLPEGSDAWERLVRIRRAAERAASLTHQMLAYAGTESMHVTRVNISRIVRDLWSLLEAAVTPRAVFVFELPEDLPLIEGDAAQLSQMVMNLVTNASEAVGDRSGHISLSTGTIDATRSYLDHITFGADLSEGPHVFLEVADTGCGMDDEMLSRIFDPFFTTKFTGRGLGLAAVLGIARAHQGAIEVTTAPNQGTKVRILMPCGLSAG